MQAFPDGSPGHEFTATENQVIGRLATLMKITGIVQMVVGVLQIGGFLGRTFALREEHAILRIGVDIPVAIAFIAGGLFLYLAAPPFRLVVETEGNDIDHVMTACKKLSFVMTLLAGSFAFATLVWIVMFAIFLATGTPLFGQGN